MTPADLREACEKLVEELCIGYQANYNKIVPSMNESLLRFARQQQAAVWREAACVARQFSKRYDIDWLQSATKQDVAIKVCLDIAELCEAKAGEVGE